MRNRPTNYLADFLSRQQAQRKDDVPTVVKPAANTKPSTTEAEPPCIMGIIGPRR